MCGNSTEKIRHNMKNKTLFRRIFVSNLIVSALVIAALAAGAIAVIDRMYRGGVEKTLMNSSALIAASLDGGEPVETVAKICEDFAKESGVRSTIIDSRGNVVFDSGANPGDMTNHLNRPEIARALKGERVVFSRHSNTLDVRMTYIAVPAGKNDGGGYEYAVRLSLPNNDLAAAKRVFGWEIVLLSIAAILFSGLFSFFIARKISGAVGSLGAVAQDIARGNLDARAGVSDIFEITRLGESMNEMAEQLKKRVASLNKRSTELSEIFSHMSECVFICAEDGRLMRFNESAAKIFGVPHGEASGLKFKDAIRNRQVLVAIDKTFKTRETVSCDIDLDGAGKRMMSLEGFMLPYESKTPRALFVMHDISHIKEAETLRRDFVSGVSHELKTPITAIKASAETLADVDDKADILRFSAIIEKEADRLNALVDNMLLLSKIEFTEEAYRDNFETVNVASVLDEVFSMHESEAKKHGDALSVDYSENIFVKGDFTLLVIAVSNLVGNAIKYSADGSSVDIFAQRSGENVDIIVKDNGAGIAPAHIERLFERFYRVDKGRSRNMGGTGLGLAIAKHVAMLHGGTISVESAEGKGSIFKISLKTA